MPVARSVSLVWLLLSVFRRPLNISCRPLHKKLYVVKKVGSHCRIDRHPRGHVCGDHCVLRARAVQCGRLYCDVVTSSSAKSLCDWARGFDVHRILRFHLQRSVGIAQPRNLKV